MAVVEQLRQAVVDGQTKVAVAKATKAPADGVPADVLLQRA
jgi:hypothetical protein